MDISLVRDALNRVSYAADAIEAITYPDTIDELGGERIHNGIFTALYTLRAELDKATAELDRAAAEIRESWKGEPA